MSLFFEPTTTYTYQPMGVSVCILIVSLPNIGGKNWLVSIHQLLQTWSSWFHIGQVDWWFVLKSSFCIMVFEVKIDCYDLINCRVGILIYDVLVYCWPSLQELWIGLLMMDLGHQIAYPSGINDASSLIISWMGQLLSFSIVDAKQKFLCNNITYAKWKQVWGEVQGSVS